MSNKPVTVYGIDLGTTYSCIASVDEYGKPTVIKNAEGENITPSVVQFDGTNRVVGREAKNVAQMYHDSTVEMVKRQMGNADWRYPYDGVEYRAEEISSYILRKVVSDAETHVGESITDVVITCPAYFSINEREATAAAGKIAGLNVRGIINEPTAAAIAYGVQQDMAKDMVAFVYDLGGGTFDITMIAIKSGEIEVIATNGDHHLGGRNWDEVIVNYLAEQWKQETGSQDDPLDDPETTQDLFGKAENAKKALSSREKTEVAVTHAGKRAKVTLTVDKFEELTQSLLERATLLTRQTLEAASAKGYPRFDQLLLVGGSTRMRQVAQQLRADFGAEPQSIDPDEVVAKGAAIYGMKLALGDEIRVKLEGWGVGDGQEAPPDMVRKAEEQVASERGLTLPGLKKLNVEVTNVVSHSFGVEVIQAATGKAVVSNLIIVNDRLPASVAKKFGTFEANQDSAEIRIMQNESTETTAEIETSKEIGTATLPLPPGLPADAPIEITLTLDAEGRLHVTGRDLTGKGVVEGDYTAEGVISEAETAEAMNRSRRLTVS